VRGSCCSVRWLRDASACGEAVPSVVLLAALSFVLVVVVLSAGGPLLAAQPSASFVQASGKAFRECRECPEMVVVPPGRFRETRKDFSEASGLAQPNGAEVIIRRAFAVAKYPVTRAEYAEFVSETNRQQRLGCKAWRNGVQWTLDPGASWSNPGFAQTEDDPVVCVSWEDAHAYVKWLNLKARGRSRIEGLGTGPYRLLNLHEAEYATRAGSKTDYYWGDRPDRRFANYGADDCSRCFGVEEGADRWTHTSPVGSFRANGFGLYDMSGNVAEFADNLLPGNPWSKDIATARFLVGFGGSWLDKAERMKIGTWIYFTSVDSQSDIGFRVARSLNSEDIRALANKPDAPRLGPLPSSARYVVEGENIAQPFGSLNAGSHIHECAECPELVVLPPGQFYDRAMTQWTDITPMQPVVLVTFSKPYAIGVYDVTREQYAAFVRDTHRPQGGCELLERGNFWISHPEVSFENPTFPQTDRDPAVCVSWLDAHAYVEWVNARAQKVRPAGVRPGRYRLPSGEELRYAARGGNISLGRPFYWGMLSSHDYANFGLNPCCGDGIEGADQWAFTSPVGSFPPNAFGIYDGYGNVWQVTDDCFHNSGKGLPRDGSAWSAGGNCHIRSLQGPSFDDEELCNCRNNYAVDARNFANGFRVVRTIE
jgi:sulfatase modifying factor 1